MKPTLWLSFATCITASSLAVAAPTGHLGYLKSDKAIVSDACTGRETVLPRGGNVPVLRVAPGGDALYFVLRPGEKSKGISDTFHCDGLLAKAPYKTARQLPALTNVYLYSAEWNRSSSTIYVSAKGVSGAYTPSSRRLQQLKSLPADQSRDGRTLVFVDEGALRVQDTTTGRNRVVFSAKQPQPLFNAINRAQNPKRIQDLKGAISPDLWKETRNWQLDAVALDPSGKRLYFASNAGTGMGAAGNATWALFACDLESGRISVLSKTGAFFSRSPDVMKVSPDGTRLLLQTSAHSSAIDNACSVYVVDLLTQNSRELLLGHAPKNTDTNIAGGAVWSPDSKYVAFAALYYSTAAVMQRPSNGDWDFDPKAWRLSITEAATGKVARVIPGATSPSWGR